MNSPMVGVGDRHYRVAVCIGNCPDMPEFQTLDSLKPLEYGDIQRIVDATGNHWRKIFNIFAKLMYQLDKHTETTWQDYRDCILLQQGCGHALIFSSFESLPPSDGAFLIVAGKSYAKELGVFESVKLLGEGIYIDTSANVIVTPYFDYRQLSNRKLDMLISLIKGDLKPEY